MPLLKPDIPYGTPAFALSIDQIATVLDLICRAVEKARPSVQSGCLEVPITIMVRKEMRRIKKALGLTNLEIRGEHELENMAGYDPSLLGRIDITLKFLHQFGDEDAYVAIECKRIRVDDAALNRSYVGQGVDRFATGKYAAGHEWGFMLGYVLSVPVEKILADIDRRLQKTFGPKAALTSTDAHPLALTIKESVLLQKGNHAIRLKHVFVDMLTAAP
jgi:hypothetical protein